MSKVSQIILKGFSSEQTYEAAQWNKTISMQRRSHRSVPRQIDMLTFQICGWRFLQSYNLKKHVLTHGNGNVINYIPEKILRFSLLGSKKVRCTQCKASFPDQKQLADHVLRKHNQACHENRDRAGNIEIHFRFSLDRSSLCWTLLRPLVLRLVTILEQIQKNIFRFKGLLN